MSRKFGKLSQKIEYIIDIRKVAMEKLNEKVAPAIVRTTSCNSRLTVIAITCMLSFALPFCSEITAALQYSLENDCDMSLSLIALLNSAHHLGIIVVFAATVMHQQKLNHELDAINSTVPLAAVVLGYSHLMFCYIANMKSIMLALLFRVIQGIAVALITLSLPVLASNWFPKDELKIIGLQLMFYGLGSVVNFNTAELIFAYLDSTLFISFGMKGVILGLPVFFILKVAALSCIELNITDTSGLRTAETKNVKPTKICPTSVLRSGKFLFFATDLIYASYMTAVLAFIAFGNSHLRQKYSFDPELANMMISLIPLMIAAFCPIFLRINGVGNITWMIVGISVAVVAQLLLMFVPISPAIPIMLLGISAASIASRLWTLLSVVLTKSELADGYGLIVLGPNLNLVLSSYVFSITVTLFKGAPFEWSLLVLFTFSFVMSLMLWIMDYVSNGRRMNLGEYELRIKSAKIKSSIVGIAETSV